MKRILALVVACFAAFPACAQSVDATLDNIINDSNGTFAKLSVLDKSDKKIKDSNAAQVFSTQAANKLEREVKTAAVPLQMDANRADQMRSQLLSMGCPEGGGRVALSLAQRCNPLIAKHRALHDAVFRKAAELKGKMQTVRTLRERISKTTLENAAQQKRNDSQRATLMAHKLELETRAVILGLKNKVAAEKACNLLSGAEAKVCCHKAAFDGSDPKLCGVEAMCQAFERGGLFGGRLVVCHAVASR